MDENPHPISEAKRAACDRARWQHPAASLALALALALTVDCGPKHRIWSLPSDRSLDARPLDKMAALVSPLLVYSTIAHQKQLTRLLADLVACVAPLIDVPKESIELE
mgnify:CR=1 FL=1